MTYRAKVSIEKARHLYQETIRAKLTSGCLEVSLQALGGNAHFMDILDREDPKRKPSMLFDVIERKGLAINWIAGVDQHTTPEQFEAIFTDKVHTDRYYPAGVLTGYLALENYPENSHLSDHAIAILPRHLMPKNVRKSLKKNNSFMVVDTSALGLREVTLQQFAHYSRAVAEEGGRWAIAQIRKRPDALR